MATTTPNNGWTVPTSTDYVKDGATAIETLGDAIDASVGTGLLAWQSYAPVLAGTGWSNGNGIWDAKYVKIGKTVHWRARFTLGSTTGKGTGNLSFSLPIAATSSNGFAALPGLSMVAGNSTSYLYGVINDVNYVTVYALNAASTYALRSSVTNTAPATWATNDYFMFSGTYEVA